jgi:hypothetical protein
VTVTVRAARPAELARLAAIEMTGEAMFAEHGIVFPPGPATIKAAVAHGADVLVAGDPPVAFAAIVDMDGHPHLEQISVQPTRDARASEARCCRRSCAGQGRA